MEIGDVRIKPFSYSKTTFSLKRANKEKLVRTQKKADDGSYA